MKTVIRFRSFEDLKAYESSRETDSVILKLHHAFEKLLALLRSKIVRQSDRPKR